MGAVGRASIVRLARSAIWHRLVGMLSLRLAGAFWSVFDVTAYFRRMVKKLQRWYLKGQQQEQEQQQQQPDGHTSILKLAMF
jgi:hypothetical protein